METRVHKGPLVIGGGLAGLSAALEAVPVKGVSSGVLVVTPAPLLDACSSAWAQGGMAAALSAGDSPQLHARDTEAAGAGLVEIEAVRELTGRGRETVEWLAGLGAPFDRAEDGGFAVSLEAAHSIARVARVGGDGAGRAILSAVVKAARAADHIEIWEDGRLRALVTDAAGRVRGAVIERTDGLVQVLAQAVVLATGGIGGLFEVTTNPSALKGEGMALAYLAGAEILDPEFVQFHPTAIDAGLDPAPLATEALRGEGARLVDREGRFQTLRRVILWRGQCIRRGYRGAGRFWMPARRWVQSLTTRFRRCLRPVWRSGSIRVCSLFRSQRRRTITWAVLPLMTRDGPALRGCMPLASVRRRGCTGPTVWHPTVFWRRRRSGVWPDGRRR